MPKLRMTTEDKVVYEGHFVTEESLLAFMQRQFGRRAHESDKTYDPKSRSWDCAGTTFQIIEEN